MPAGDRPTAPLPAPLPPPPHAEVIPGADAEEEEDPGLQRARRTLSSYVGGVVGGTCSVAAVLRILATAETALGGPHGTMDVSDFVVAAIGGRMLMLEGEADPTGEIEGESELCLTAHRQAAGSACEFLRTRTLPAHTARKVPLVFTVRAAAMRDLLDAAVDRCHPLTLTYLYELGVSLYGQESGGLCISAEQWQKIPGLLDAAYVRGVDLDRINHVRDILKYFVLGRPTPVIEH